MNYIEHLFFSLAVNGVVLFVLAFLGFTIEITPLLFFAYFVFTLLPDIDSRHSKASQLLFAALSGLLLYSIIEILLNGFTLLSVGGIILAISFFLIHLAISRDDKFHRAFPHTPSFGVISCSAFFLITLSPIATLVAAVSFLSHLVADKNVQLR